MSYFFVAISGYAAYGNTVAEDVLLTIAPSGDGGIVVATGWVALANIMVLVHVVAAFQVFSHPIFEAVETPLLAHFAVLEARPRVLRLVWRSIYVLLIALIAWAVPFFQDLMGLIGAVGFIPMTFIMPCVLYLAHNKGRLRQWELVVNYAIIGVFVTISLASFIAAAANIADKADSCSYDGPLD